MKEITKSQLLDFLAFHGINNIHIENSSNINHKSTSKSNIENQQNQNSTQQNITYSQSISSNALLNNNRWSNSSTSLARMAQRRWEQYEYNARAQHQRQERQNFIEWYERMQELDRKYPITPWSAVDLATRGIGYRKTERYNQYKQEIGQEEARKREQELIIQQNLARKLQRTQNKSQ